MVFANKVTQQEIDLLMNTANVEEVILFNKTLVVAYEFPQLGGWTIRGEGSVVDSAAFNRDLGFERAKKDINNKLWEFMGFLKQLEMKGCITWNTSL